MFLVTIFVAGGVSFSEKVHAQTSPLATNQNGQSEFKNDVEHGIQEVKNDKGAQNNQQEIDNEDTGHAGDEHGDAKEVDGENNQNEIDTEIEQEVEQEDSASGQSSNQESNTTSTSSENGAHSGNTEN